MTIHQNHLKYISQRQSKMTTPDDRVAKIVIEALNAPLVHKERIVKGEGNEVYDILVSNTHYILRISRKNDIEFEREKWAMDHCRKVGVPVPDILFIKRYPEWGISVCIETKLEGKPLDEYHMLENRDQILRESGRILHLIHSIKTEKFGDLDEHGKGTFETFTQYLLEKNDKTENFNKIALKFNLDNNVFTKAIHLLTENSPRYQAQSSVLSTNDYGPKHIMLSHGKVTGIIDMGIARATIPADDFASWDFWFGDEYPTELLREGYTDKAIFNEDFETLFLLCKLHNGLIVADWYGEPENESTHGIMISYNQLVKTISNFK